MKYKKHVILNNVLIMLDYFAQIRTQRKPWPAHQETKYFINVMK